ncbi:non-specific serine/threonine protein kinase [Actinopolymorpha cephalotaxi]|uniref:Non-specific serine/threonine protein kinase n=1 Tax=Actinopolymorpha cephalotaxi TaxID=504797 RepID=A0A1I2K6D4_9ACTN|nr:LuxR C-terminal-related transcriptional regulator [Actinopolymorpha cephalotaxi]NYH85907.1 non-specific serine/threonine protein kinase [Actinopolymorpha cephalotaxi]SFF62672.1 non-specific serine/threonine protein kinase [Actinopolymorpha cephalotaxi]
MTRPESDATAQVGNLPADTTSFVGRRRELAEVKRLLSVTRMVTLTGLGGVGKTRLALRAAHALRRTFRDGVWLVDLANVTDPALVAPTVAESLRVLERSRRDPARMLADHLRDRHLLVVLDNCEHLPESCAVLADRLLSAAPGLHLLVTSRQRLDVATEHTLTVPPLPLPDARDHPGGDAADGREAGARQVPGRFEAVALFVDRAAAVQHDFVLTEENQDAVVAICRRLDGIPLAIELAAARVRALTPGQIRDRLDQRYGVLTAGPGCGDPRHRTLEAMLDWSYDLCSAGEQAMWARSSVFANAFDLDAAESVCAGDDLAREDVMDLVTGLIDKSVLLREDHAGRAGYRQLTLVRDYGLRRLAEQERLDATRRRHFGYFRQEGARTARQVFAPHQVEWFARLRREHDDLRAALDLALADPDLHQDGVRLAADLLFHWLNGYLNEGREWLDRLLAATAADTAADTPGTAPAAGRADALWANAWLALIQTDFPAARTMLAQARSILETEDAPSTRGYVELFSGMLATATGDTDAGLAHYARALELHRAGRNPHGIASTLIRSAMAHSALGDSAQAVELAEEALSLCTDAGDLWHRAYVLLALGIEVWREGDVARATILERESLRHNQRLDDQVGVALNLQVLALAAASAGQPARAAGLFGALDSLSRALGLSLTGYTHLSGYQERCVRELRATLGEEAYARAFAEGAERGHDHAIAVALQEEPDRRGVRSGPGNSPLTRREREIADLIAQGRTNKQIAGALVIAQRTAESHVENILVKLGFTSRAQVAAWTAEQGRTDEGHDDR